MFNLQAKCKIMQLKLSHCKKNGGQVVIWVCVAATAHGYLAVIEVTMNFCVCIYIYILEINVRLSVWQQKFASCNTRLISSIAANLQKNGLRCCNGPALTDMLWWVRKRAVRKWIPTNLNELTQIPPQWCERLVITQKTITSIYCC